MHKNVNAILFVNFSRYPTLRLISISAIYFSLSETQRSWKTEIRNGLYKIVWKRSSVANFKHKSVTGSFHAWKTWQRMTHFSSRNICFSPSMLYRTDTHTRTHTRFSRKSFFPSPSRGKIRRFYSIVTEKLSEESLRVFVFWVEWRTWAEKKKKGKKKEGKIALSEFSDVARWRELVEEPPPSPVGDFNSVIWQIGRVRSCRLSPFDFHPGQRTIFRYRFIMGIETHRDRVSTPLSRALKYYERIFFSFF